MIHSGKGTLYRSHWSEVSDEIEAIAGERPPLFEEIAGRGIIGACRVVACCDVRHLKNACSQHGLSHCRAERWSCGPRCLLLTDVVALAHPLPMRGFQGLFDVPDEAVADALAAAGFRDWG